MPPEKRTLDSDLLNEAHNSARIAAQAFRVCYDLTQQSGRVGSFLAYGVGSSIDFQDQRGYVPGDDPRYINWNAYARSGSLTLKLYRPEISPKLDLVLDLSESMLFDEQKRFRVLELAYFVFENALKTNASFRCVGLAGAESFPISTGQFNSYRISLPAPKELGPFNADSVQLPLRPKSIRIFLSDLLFPGRPSRTLGMLGLGRSQLTILAPYCAAEEDPDWSGNMLFEDCESGLVRKQQVDSALLSKYQAAYRAHFDMWEQECVRSHVPLARIDSIDSLMKGLQEQALPAKAVELWN